MSTLRTSQRRHLRLAPAGIAGIVYLAVWIVGLAIWPSNLAITDSSREVVNAYGAHRSVAVAQFLLVEGVAAIALAFVLVAVARAAGRAGAVSRSCFIFGAGLTACLVSAAECVLGVVLATSLAAPVHVHRAGEVFDAINRFDGVKMLLLATVIATAVSARRELPLARWLSGAGVMASLALVASGVGYLALNGALAHATFLSLPLLLIWVSGTGVALTRRHAEDRAPGSAPKVGGATQSLPAGTTAP
jgi:hypothetical protein